MTNEEIVQMIIEVGRAVSILKTNNEYLERSFSKEKERARKLENSLHKFKYEYEDSKLQRDVALPYKWKAKEGKTSTENQFRMFCPKCGAELVDWYTYCAICGQKILQGNPQESERIPWEDETE